MAIFGRTFARPQRAAGGGLFAPALQTASGPGAATAAPVTRELRAQAVHRLQVGLFGLAGMLLLISLANVIMDRAHEADAGAVSPAASASAEPANDPLVDMGVAPELPATAVTTPRKPARGAPAP